MSVVEYRVLITKDIKLIKKGKKEDEYIEIREGGIFKYNSKKEYEPNVQELLEKGIIENILVPSSNEVDNQSIKEEQVKDKDSKITSILPWGKNKKDKKDEDKELKQKSREVLKEDTKQQSKEIPKKETKQELNKNLEDSKPEEIIQEVKETEVKEVSPVNEQSSQLDKIESTLAEMGKVFTNLLNSNQAIVNKQEEFKLELAEVKEVKKQLEELKKKVDSYPSPLTPNNFKESIDEVTRKVRQNTDAINKTTSEVNTSVSNGLNQVSNKISSNVVTTINLLESKINDLPRKFDEKLNDSLEDTVKSSTRSLKKSVDETRESLESLEGKVIVLDDLKGKLDKVNFSKKLEAFNQEDDVIIELAEQGHEILNQFTLASRHYIASKNKVTQLEEENVKLTEQQDKIEASITKAVELQVKNEVTNEIITKVAQAFSRLDDVYTDEKLVGIQALLTNYGLVQSEEFKVGNMIEVTEANRQLLEGQVKFEYAGEGTYTIIQSQFVWRDTKNSFEKAVAEKSAEESEKKEATEEVVEVEQTEELDSKE